MVVTTPASSSLTVTAIDLAKTIVESEHELIGVFFYQDGVLNASTTLAIPSDEFQSHQAWQTLNNDYGLPLHLCITAAEKRGLTDDESLMNIDSHFTISGLGELVELTNLCDRVIQL